VEKYLADLQKNPESMGLYAGIAVYDLNEQTYVYTHNEKRNYIPASNMKLFTAVSALDRLGPAYQWKTEVYIDGKVNPGGVLQANLILKGYGDPTLQPEDLQALAAAVKDKGINQIKGDLLLDESYFDDVRLGTSWMWDDEPYGYSAQLSALAVRQNAVTLTAAPQGKAGAPATLSLEPAAENNLHGKTGTMSGVNSLSGYITTKGGEKLVFSIIVNGYAASSKVMTDLQDQIATILASLE